MKEQFFGKEKNIMGNNRFRLMAFLFNIRDTFIPYGDKIEEYGIKKGDVVVDCGCGTGSCLRKASQLVGAAGTVYAVDVHDLAINLAKKISGKKEFSNIIPVKSSITDIPLKDGSADCIYALDMFHMVAEPTPFLKELYRITKKTGRLIIEDGHQPRSQSKQKIIESGVWKISEETHENMVCVPL